MPRKAPEAGKRALKRINEIAAKLQKDSPSMKRTTAVKKASEQYRAEKKAKALASGAKRKAKRARLRP